jgi:hypothetical protein
LAFILERRCPAGNLADIWNMHGWPAYYVLAPNAMIRFKGLGLAAVEHLTTYSHRRNELMAETNLFRPARRSGRHYRLDGIEGRRFVQTASRAHLPESLVIEELREVCKTAPGALAMVQ